MDEKECMNHKLSTLKEELVEPLCELIINAESQFTKVGRYIS